MGCVLSPQEELAIVGEVAAGTQQGPALSSLYDTGPDGQRGLGWDRVGKAGRFSLRAPIFFLRYICS